MKTARPAAVPKSKGLFFPVLLAVILAVLFARSFLPGYVHFSNDGPLGAQKAEFQHLPEAMFGQWDDLNDIGGNVGTFSPSITALIRWSLGAVGYSKFIAPIALFILGLGAWTFFRQLKLSPLAAALGALAVALNAGYFGGACWSVAAVEIALGFNFFALALIVANDDETSWLVRWTRLALAGLCVGINVIEAADIGALCSLFIAGFVFFKSLADSSKPILTKALRGIGHVAVVAVFAGFIAVQTVVSLIGTSITGVAGTAQDAETKAQHWDWATQWSLPKVETLGIVVPGLFGYRMDTPKDMLPALQDAYRGGIYWGGMGRSPEIDRFFDSGAGGNPPSEPGMMMRFGYGGYYCGILVVLAGFWALAQSFRRQNSPFSDTQKKFIWFWGVVLVASLLLAWGRFAPMFYGALYHLPYFSTIRNPTKFLVFFSWALAVLFAYGVHGLNRRFLGSDLAKPVQGKIAARKLDAFDRRWILACVGIFGASVIGWLIFSGEKSGFIQYLQKVGYGDEDLARQIAAFCLGQIEWFLVLFAIALTLLALVIAGYFSGARAKLGAVLLGAFLIFDMGRANLPWIIHWDYKQKYESNPIIDILRDKPYEHRVAALPFRSPPQFGSFDELYRIEWMQHHFPYYNIESLDIIQSPRVAADLAAYDAALAPVAPYLVTRRWELSNTRYLLGPAGFLDVMNEQLDPVQHRFRIVQRFSVLPKPGIAIPDSISPEQFVKYLPPDKVTASTNDNGDYALFEFTGALPRAKLYSNWQVNTNDNATLKILVDKNFDPQKIVLVSENLPAAPTAASTNENSGKVEFKSYFPSDIVLSAQSDMPSVLLLNDKFDSHWRVFVDGKPAELLRCNFIMRGVYLASGTHMVEFQFKLPDSLLYVTLTAFVTGIFLCGCLLYGRRVKSNPSR